MKREICCSACVNKWKSAMGWNSGKGSPGRYPDLNDEGEGMRVVTGTNTRSLSCDGCGRECDPGRPAFAVSLYTDSRPYFDWESDFLDDRADLPPDPDYRREP